MNKRIKISLIVSAVVVLLMAIPVFVMAASDDLTEDNFKYTVTDDLGKEIDCVWVSNDKKIPQNLEENLKEYEENTKWYKYIDNNKCKVSNEEPPDDKEHKIGKLYIVQKGKIILESGKRYNKTIDDAEAFNLEPYVTTQAPPDLVYESSNPEVVFVNSEKDEVIVKGAGTATVTVGVSQDQKDFFDINDVKAEITVRKRANKIDSEICYVKTYGESNNIFNLEATASSGKVEYKISEGGNDDVLTVDETGRVQIKKAGTAKIDIVAAATDEYEEAEKTVKVHVLRADNPISGVDSYYEITYGDDDFYLNAKSVSNNIKYESSDPEVASVDENGKVIIKKSGITEVKVASPKDDCYKNKEKTVIIKVEKASVSNKYKGKNYSKYIGTGTFSLDMANDNDGYNYKTDNKKVASVDNKGEVSIKGYDSNKGSSKAIITVSASEDNPYYKGEISIGVTVKALEKPVLKVKQLGHLKTQFSWKKIEGAQKYQLYYKYGKKYYLLPGCKNLTKTKVTVKAKRRGKDYIMLVASTKVDGKTYSTKSKLVLSKVK